MENITLFSVEKLCGIGRNIFPIFTDPLRVLTGVWGEKKKTQLRCRPILKNKKGPMVFYYSSSTAQYFMCTCIQ